ncbi:MAG: serine/threonine-protein kinase [Myxococcota bacterium]
MEERERSTSGPAEPPSSAVDSDLGDRLLKGRIYEQLFPSVPAPSRRLGRFTLLRELGRGGMGVVFAAYDEQLDRRVAIKLLHADASRDEAARGRLLREAQALARLSHPNVVQVHESGVLDDRVCLVMEFVPGQTLRAWLDDVAPQGRDRWRAVLEVMVAAGEGLAAAHEAGLLHRDFKPDNVLVGDDRRVRVADFGLAAEGGQDTTDDGHRRASPTSDTEGQTPRPLERLTRTGAAVGTAVYMPLEQLHDQPLDARSDQFSFCVTLYEALFGERPFAAPSRAALIASLDNGEPRVPTGASTVPRWLRRVLWRGLSKDPAQRFDGMPALLSALTRPLRTRRLGLISATVLVAVGVGLGAGLTRGQPSAVAPPEPCLESGRAMDETWSDRARSKVREALTPAAARFTTAALDEWAEGWRDTSRTACEQVHVEQTASTESLDRRGRCLDEHRHRLASVLRVLEMQAPTGPTVVSALAVLDDPADCLLDQADPLAGLDEEQRRLHRQLSDRLVELDLVQSGRSVAARRAQVLEVYEQAKVRELGVVQAEAAYFLGRLAALSADLRDTQRWLGEAIDRSEALGLDPLRTRAWLLSAETSLFLELQPSRAEWIWQRVEGQAERLPHPHVQHAQVAMSAARIDLEGGRLDRAEEQLRRAHRELEPLGRTASRHRATALSLQALVADRKGQRDLAVELTRKARQLELLDPTAPHGGAMMGTERFQEGMALLQNGDLDGARTTLTKARHELERELPGSRRLAQTLVALSAVSDAVGEFEAARHHAEAADVIIRRLGGATDPERVEALSARGVAAFRQAHHDDAAQSFELALQIAESIPEPDATEVAFHAINLAEAEQARGRQRAAERLLQDAVATLEHQLGPEHPDLALPYKVRGAVGLAQGQLEPADHDLRRALTLYEQTNQSPVETAETRWLHVQVLEQLGRLDEARTAAQRTAAAYEALGPEMSPRLSTVKAWLDRQETRP